MGSKGVAKLVVIVAVLTVALATLAGWVWYQGSQDDNGSDTEIVNSGSDSGEDETEEEQGHPDDWVEYESVDFGFSFAYPEEWGEVEAEQDEGVSGSAFSLSFSNHENVTLTGESLDYESIMGPSSILGAKGWVVDGNSYYFIMDDQQVLAEGAEELESGEGIYQVDTSPEAVYSANELHRISFNLSSTQYDGAVFLYRITDDQTIADRDEFTWMLMSLELL